MRFSCRHLISAEESGTRAAEWIYDFGFGNSAPLIGKMKIISLDDFMDNCYFHYLYSFRSLNGGWEGMKWANSVRWAANDGVI